MTQKHPAIRSGFSLVEMLVVIGIIVMTLGICAPIIMSARRSARMTLCLNNLSQLGQLYTIYASANHERIPLGTSYRPPAASDYATSMNQFVWLNGGPSSCAGPLLASLMIKQKDAGILFCPLEAVKPFRAEINLPLIAGALEHGAVTIQSSYAVRPVHCIWTHNPDGTVTYPFPMVKFVRQHNYALMAEHPQFRPYTHERSDGDAQINVLYADTSVRPVYASQFTKQYDAYVAAAGGSPPGTTDASNKLAINETDKTADTIWRVMDED